jgi:nicotinamidase-related amidase
LRSNDVSQVLIVGFYTHGCISTSAREALVRGFDVSVDPNATGATDMKHHLLGEQTADEVRRYALLHLANMGVTIPYSDEVQHEDPTEIPTLNESVDV